MEAIDIYRSKDIIEKAFGDLKSRLNLRRTSVSIRRKLGEANCLFNMLLSIIVSHIKEKMDDAELFKKYTIQSVLDELDVIESFQKPGTKRMFGEVTKRQTGVISSVRCWGHFLGINFPGI